MELVKRKPSPSGELFGVSGGRGHGLEASGSNIKSKRSHSRNRRETDDRFAARTRDQSRPKTRRSRSLGAGIGQVLRRLRTLSDDKGIQILI